MLRVKTKIKTSEVNGIGLFADQFIPAGTVTWKYDQGFDPHFTIEQFESLPDFTKETILTHGYFDHQLNVYILCSDDQRFINHSQNPNITSTPSEDVANKDIHPGDELTCDYSQYEQDWFERRDVDRSSFV
ncbi:MAG: SET domain-containing protein [Patescibacteria group bacterium]